MSLTLLWYKLKILFCLLDPSGDSLSEIASCSYEARAKGVKNGMFIFRAKELCRDLIYVPYNFDEYRNVSQTFHEILSSFTCNIEAVSCDEALLDMSDLVENGRFITW